MKRTWAVLSSLLILALLGACAAPTPQIVEKVVEKTVVVEKPVEKVVQVTQAPTNYGNVVILSTQANPVEEQEKMRGVVLKAFAGKPEFVGMEEPALIDRVLAEAKAGKGSADLLIALHGTYPTLQAANALLDLSDLLPAVKDRNIPDAFMKLGKLGTDKQYYIPVMQATYIMAANKKALQYLPAGADINALTWEQLRDWGKNITTATKDKKLGFPASDRGLMHRFLQGYIYPSYTGGMVTGFKTKTPRRCGRSSRTCGSTLTRRPLLTASCRSSCSPKRSGWLSTTRRAWWRRSRPNQVTSSPSRRPRGRRGWASCL